eukprot:8344204-Prorocentrum_lima.AAC.1
MRQVAQFLHQERYCVSVARLGASLRFGHRVSIILATWLPACRRLTSRREMAPDTHLEHITNDVGCWMSLNEKMDE